MVDVRPFRGLRYDPARVGDTGRVVAPPYDVITPAEQAALYDASPYNVVRLEHPQDAETGESRYEVAASTLRSWRDSGILRRDPTAAFYLVSHRFEHGGRTRERGELIAALRLESWSSGAILPHEHTAEGPKADRLELLRACHANLSPIMVLYNDPDGVVGGILRTATANAPVERFRSTDGDAYEVRLITDQGQVTGLREALRHGPLYIADGHHRYETALRYQGEAPPGAADYIMAALVSLEDPGLLSLPFHRLLRALPSDARIRLTRQINVYFTSEEVAVRDRAPEEIAALFAAHASDIPGPVMGLLPRDDDETLRLLRPLDREVVADLMPGRSAVWSQLSQCLFEDALLQPSLGVRQQEAEAQGRLAYARDVAEAVAVVRAGEYDMAFLLDGVPLRAMTAVADAGERLPHKSTYFHPKLATGLVINPLEEVLDGE